MTDIPKMPNQMPNQNTQSDTASGIVHYRLNHLSLIYPSSHIGLHHILGLLAFRYHAFCCKNVRIPAAESVVPNPD